MASSENSAQLRIGDIGNAAYTLITHDLQEIGFVRRKTSIRTYGPSDLASIRHPSRHPDKMPTLLDSVATALIVQSRLRPGPRSQRTIAHNPAQPRTTGAPSSQNPAPARKARPPLHFSANFVTIVDHRPRTVRSASHDQRLGTNETKNQSEDQRKTVYR
jgi:hypothetical protein